MKRTDRDLIEETLDGKLQSFDELMQRYERLVYRVALLYGRSRENALDICQNAFLKAYRHLDTFRTESSFKTWLLRITYNQGMDWVRSQNRRRETGPLESDEVGPAEEAAQESGVLSQEKRWLLVQKMNDLNPRYRLAVTLRYFRQMPLREIAAVLECSEGHVKSMLFRSVRKLRESLAGSGIEGYR